MMDYQKVVVTSLPINKVWDLAIIYFGNLGFIEQEKVPGVYVKFKRGSTLYSDTTIWRSKKMFLTLRFSNLHGGGTSISCIYSFSGWTYEGKSDYQNADMEIYGFQKYLEQTTQGNTNKKRICPKCKREIPFDARVCPYCGYDFPDIKTDKKSQNYKAIE